VILEADDAVGRGKERVVATQADVLPGLPLRAVLPHDDGAAADDLATEALDTEALRLAVATVAARSLTFLVSHGSNNLQLSRPGRPDARLGADFLDPQRRHRLAVAPRSPVVLAPLVLENTDLAVSLLADDGAHDLGVRDVRLTDLDVVAADQKNFLEGDLVSDPSLELVDLDGVASLNPLLLAAGLDDRVQNGLIWPNVQNPGC